MVARLRWAGAHNKCSGDDTKAAACQSQNCIKNKKKILRKTTFNMADRIYTHPAMWLWNHDSEFTKWQHPAMWYVALGWHAIDSPKRSPYWNSTSGFNFLHITAVDMSFCTSLRNFIQIGPPWAEENDVMSIYKMADLSLGSQGSNNGLLEKPM